MYKSKLRKKIKIITTMVIGLAVLELVGVLPYIAARTSSSIYVAKNYPKSGYIGSLKFKTGDSSTSPRLYTVWFKDKYGIYRRFMLYPKRFPIFVKFDEFKEKQ